MEYHRGHRRLKPLKQYNFGKTCKRENSFHLMCKVRCEKHQQCACECRPLHFQRHTTLYHVPKVSHSLLISTEQRQIHTHWCWDSYVYASYKRYGRTVCQIARRNRFSQPLTILDILANTPSIPNQNQEEPHHPLTHV